MCGSFAFIRFIALGLFLLMVASGNINDTEKKSSLIFHSRQFFLSQMFIFG